jgi:hypothetical protein
MDQNNPVAVVEKLAEICKDGEMGYKDAAEHAKRSDLRAFFTTQSSERGRFARELQDVLTNGLLILLSLAMGTFAMGIAR